MIKHIEFLDRDHFEYRYFRRKAPKGLSHFIEFFWETNFDELFKQAPNGFVDLLFPSLGYTYLINLGTPFVMQLDQQLFPVKGDSFLPRFKNLATHHSRGNKIFGIKFKVSPVILEKRVNFSEYRHYLFPLAYLMDARVTTAVKKAASFNDRVAIVSRYFAGLISKYEGSLRFVDVVTAVLEEAEQVHLSAAVEYFAQRHGLSARTLQRYFEAATGINTRSALQMLRLRKAITQMINEPATFDFSALGFYDYSHFYKQVNRFLKAHPLAGLKSHTDLIARSEARIMY